MAVSNKLIKLMREERGWSQEQLAAISDLSDRTIQRVEKDGKCSLETKMALASAFEVSPLRLEKRGEAPVFEEERVDWAGTIGYFLILTVLPLIFYFLTNTHGVWEIGSLIIVDGLILAITIASHGVDDTIRFFGNSFSHLRKSVGSDDLNVSIVQANQIIKYAYTFGCLAALVYLLVTLTQAPDRYLHINKIIVEAVTPIFYSTVLVELWIRPFKHKMEKALIGSQSSTVRTLRP